MIKVLILGILTKTISKNSVAGTEIWTYEYASFLKKKGYDVTLICSNYSSIDEFKTISIAKPMNDYNYLYDIYRNIQEIVKAIEIQDDYDIIHCSMFMYEVLLAFKNFFRKPICITVHSDFFSQEIFNTIKEENLLHFCFISNKQKSFVNLNYNYSIIPNGINTQAFDSVIKKQKIKTRNYLFWIGRICHEKGTSDAIKIAKELNLPLIIAGPISDYSYFNDKILPELNSKITYVKEVGFEDKIILYSNAIATLLPIHWEEPFGLTSIESLYCETPVIAYKKGAFSELLENNVTGLLVDENDILSIIENFPKIRLIDTKYCKQLVKEKYSIQIMGEKYLNVYHELISKKAGKEC